MIKVLLTAELLRSETPTGLEVYVEHLLRTLAKHSDVDLTILVEQTQQADRVAPGLPRIIYGPPGGFGGSPATRGIFCTLASPPDLSHFDVVHFPNVIPPFFRIPNGPRYVMTIHDAIPLLMPKASPFFSPRFYRYVLPHLIPHIDGFIANSETTKRDLVNVVGTPAEKTWVTLLGPARPVPDGPPLDDKDDYLLAVGTIEPRKNLSRIIEAFLRVKARRPDLADHLKLAGRMGWSKRSEFHRQIQSAHGQVDVTGYISDTELTDLYRHAKALVYPSLYEGFGLPVLEAMAAGCPVITSNVSSLPEVGGDAVLYVDPTDTGQIAAAMERVMTEPVLRRELIDKGLEQAKKFSWEKCAAETVEVYRRILAEK